MRLRGWRYESKKGRRVKSGRARRVGDEMVATSMMMCGGACARAGTHRRPGDSTGGCRPGRPSGLEIKELLPGARRYSIGREARRGRCSRDADVGDSQ